MELGPKLTLATAPSSESGEAEYYISDVHPIEEEFGFTINDTHKTDRAQFLYATREDAERAREAMFPVLRMIVGFVTAD